MSDSSVEPPRGPRASQGSQVDPRRQAVRLMALVSLVPALVLGLVALVGGVVVAVVVFVVVAAVVGVLVWWGADRRVALAVGGRPADPRSDARLVNLAEGLCSSAGVRMPELRVVEATGLNALIAGRRPSAALLVVTSGLLAGLSRVELEAVLADELIAIRHRQMLPATLVASLPPLVGRFLPLARRNEEEGDRAAVALTRYPPGLLAAFEKMAGAGTSLETPPALAALWLAEPLVAPVRSSRLSVTQRIEALQSL